MVVYVPETWTRKILKLILDKEIDTVNAPGKPKRWR